MFRICKRYTFEASHRLKLHEGKCRNRHGHSYKVDVTFQGGSLQNFGPETGMLVDFDAMDEIVKPIIDKLDHTNLNKNQTLNVVHPTAEVIAQRIANLIKAVNGLPNVTLCSVRVWETEKCWAEWLT